MVDYTDFDVPSFLFTHKPSVSYVLHSRAWDDRPRKFFLADARKDFNDPNNPTVYHVHNATSSPYTLLDRLRYLSRYPQPWDDYIVVEANNRSEVTEWLVSQGHMVNWGGRIRGPGDPKFRSSTTLQEESRTGNMSAVSNEMAALQAAVRRAEQRMDFLLSLPEEPKAKDGRAPVITFSKRFQPGGYTYAYAAIQAGGKWYTSGPKGGSVGRSWDNLITWINEVEPTPVYLMGKPKPL